MIAGSSALQAGAPAAAGLQSAALGRDLTPTLDSIVFPTFVREHQDERRVRPALAVLFRIAVGPHADYYARRFVKYERTGRSAPSWHWPAFALPTLWAFYRKLWAYGVVCALLPLIGALAFTRFDVDIGDSSLAWWAGAALCVWLVPALVSATFANTFYHRRIRNLVRRAERNTRSAETAAKRLLSFGATDIVLAALFGAGTLLFVGSLAGPRLQAAFHEHGMRAKLAQAIAAVKPLQRQVEEDWARTRSIPQRPDYGAVRAQEGYALVQAVDLNARSGRVRVDLGPGVPELQGRSILLAPAVDAWQKVRWLCIPIDIPVSYVPAACSR
jgi:hypothetical protein